ncbi:MAG: hypothetical protein S4CHLAM2_09380 [Chlamydiales bacterium]|nr:hypothetical protein [Chlamydiales bacterium]
MSSPAVGALSPQTETSHSFFEKIQAVFHFAIDCLVMLGYLLQSVFYSTVQDKSDRSDVYEGRVVCHTRNCAKTSELWKYVQSRRNPERVTNAYKAHTATYGFTTQPSHVHAKPFNGGLCMGGVTLFLKEWLRTKGDIESLAATFDGGVPIEGAFYQERYEMLYGEQYYPGLVDTIGDDPQKLVDVKAYLKNRTRPDWVPGWADNDTYLHSTFREILSKHTGQKSSEKDHTVAALQASGLAAEVLLYDASAQDFLEKMETLAPGAYKLSFPVYGSTGERRKNTHTIGLIVGKTGSYAYIYDPNNSIAYSPKENLQTVMQRILTKHTGFDYRSNQEGIHPHLGRKVLNVLNERANPPQNPVSSGFELYRITEASPSPPHGTTPAAEQS